MWLPADSGDPGARSTAQRTIMNNAELSALIARHIFEIGDAPVDKVKRIEFKGGKWPDHETRLGGLDERALTRVIIEALNEHAPTSTEGTK